MAEDILRKPDQEILLVISTDDICRPCMHLRADGQCDDMMKQGDKIISKQAYNDDLDR